EGWIGSHDRDVVHADVPSKDIACLDRQVPPLNIENFHAQNEPQVAIREEDVVGQGISDRPSAATELSGQITPGLARVLQPEPTGDSGSGKNQFESSVFVGRPNCASNR